MRRFLLSLLLALLSASAAADGWREDAPAIKDPYEGLLPRSVLKPGDQGPIRDAASKRLAIVLSGNANTHLKWSDVAAGEGVHGADRVFATMFAGAGRVSEFDKVIATAYRAQGVTAALLQPLVDSFKEVKLMNDFAEFRDSGFEAAVLMDVAFVNTFFDSLVFIGSKYVTGTAIKAQFINAAFEAGPLVQVERKADVDRDQFHKGVIAVRNAAYDAYTAEVRKIAGPPRAVPAAAPAAAAAPPAGGSAADRLRQIEQLRKDGLITEAEAAAKRKQVLDGM